MSNNILSNINKYVSDELAKDNIPADAKYVIVGTVDNQGAQIMAAVNLHKGERFDTKVAAVWHHDWDTKDNTVGAKIIFVGK